MLAMPDVAQGQRALSALEAFLQTPVQAYLADACNQDPQAQVLKLFQDVARTVPAYQAFLDQHGIDPNTIQTPQDVETLPLLTKENYLSRHPLSDLCRDGTLSRCDMVAVSSGSTGKPTFWPRFFSDELAVARRFEQVFVDSFQADVKTTLAVVCFALGTWVGGMYTASCTRALALKGYPITLVTPGNNPEEIFRVLQDLGEGFEQVVLLGYPPFLKDVVDKGRTMGLDWQRYHIKWVMAGEVFSEEWRTLMGERLGTTNFCYDSASLYGTADAGVLGNETPLSIAIRRFLARNPAHAQALFGESRLPTLVQYDPTSRFFETHDGTLLFSGDNGIPLIRYHIADSGGIIPCAEMLEKLSDWGFDPRNELDGDRGVYPLPFVYVFGRSNFTVSYFGANIYPENVTVGLEQPEIQTWVTGKFVLETKEDADRNRTLHITVELAPGVSTHAAKQETIGTAILRELLRLNSEFKHYVPAASQQPEITLLPTGDPDYFPIGVKHRYTRM